MRHPLTDLGRSLSDATLRVHHAIARKAGLSGTDHKYVGMLTRHGAMTAGELGRLSGLSSGAVTGLVDRLAQKNLVSRQADPDDRRRILIVPNASHIKKLLGPSSARLEREVSTHVKKLSTRDARVIEKYLRDTIGILDDLSAKLQQEVEGSG